MSGQIGPAWPNDEPDPNDVGELSEDQTEPVDVKALQAQQAEEEALQDEELDELEQEEGITRPAYDQNEHDESAWCIECGQVCGHAGHRHALGDHGEIVCEQCGVTLDKTT
jgi:hypothetical protein